MSGHALITAVLDGLRANQLVQDVLGVPARLFDAETTAPVYPYATLERWETRAANAVFHRGSEHTMQIAAFTRHASAQGTKTILDTLRVAVEGLHLALPTERVVLVLPTYSDVMRTKNQAVFRGVLRVHIHTEEISDE